MTSDRILRSALLAMLFGGGGGCYSPKISEGSFMCGPGGLCPSGFTCVTTLNHCYTSPSAVGAVDMAGPQSSFVGNGLLGTLDLTGASGALNCNTETGEIDFVGTGFGSGGTTVVVSSAAQGFSQIPQANGPTVALWNFDVLIVPANVTISPGRFTSDASIPALAAATVMQIEGSIDWTGYGGVGGGPSLRGQTRGAPVEGGGLGAVQDSTGSGGGGGGHAMSGTTGGGPSSGSGGAGYGTPDLVPVQMGVGGGGGGTNSSMAKSGRGGSGGGAVILFGKKLTLGGKIDVSANPGDGASANGSNDAAGGGGGGSGGSILISADALVLESNHSLQSLGGTGGAGTTTGSAGGPGSNGRIWIGAANVTGSPSSNPTAVMANHGVATFPR